MLGVVNVGRGTHENLHFAVEAIVDNQGVSQEDTVWFPNDFVRYPKIEYAEGIHWVLVFVTKIADFLVVEVGHPLFVRVSHAHERAIHRCKPRHIRQCSLECRGDMRMRKWNEQGK